MIVNPEEINIFQRLWSLRTTDGQSGGKMGNIREIQSPLEAFRMT